MAPQRTLELLDALISGHAMSESELDDLVSNKVKEDAHLDYKHGNELNKPDPSATIRQYLSAFANSDGGILIVGVDNKTWSITGATAPGGGDLAEWASRCLTGLTPYFSPLPRMQVVPHRNGDILVASAARSIGMVPCIEKGRVTYYLRIHDQTLPAPEYLISDLLLGRRNRPDIHFESMQTDSIGAMELPDIDARAIQFDLQVVVENRGLSWAHDVTMGSIYWTLPRLQYIGEAITNNLLSYLSVDDTTNNNSFGRCNLVHVRAIFGDLRAFDTMIPNNIAIPVLPIRKFNDWYNYVWNAAIYLTCKDAPPVWYQVSIQVNNILLNHANAKEDFSLGSPLLEFKRLTSERPVVAWSDIRQS